MGASASPFTTHIHAPTQGNPLLPVHPERPDGVHVAVHRHLPARTAHDGAHAGRRCRADGDELPGGLCHRPAAVGPHQRPHRPPHSTLHRHGALRRRFSGLRAIGHHGRGRVLARVPGRGRLRGSDAVAGHDPRPVRQHPGGSDAVHAGDDHGRRAHCRTAAGRAASQGGLLASHLLADGHHRRGRLHFHLPAARKSAARKTGAGIGQGGLRQLWGAAAQPPLHAQHTLRHLLLRRGLRPSSPAHPSSTSITSTSIRSTTASGSA